MRTSRTIMTGLLLMTGLAALPAVATQIISTPLPELVKKSTYILIGKVEKVDMLDKAGKPVTDSNAWTAPGIEHVLRLHLIVDRTHILKGDKAGVPQKIVIKEWPMWWKTLAGRKEEVEGKKFIFLLDGEFRAVSEPEPLVDLAKQKEIENLLR